MHTSFKIIQGMDNTQPKQNAEICTTEQNSKIYTLYIHNFSPMLNNLLNLYMSNYNLEKQGYNQTIIIDNKLLTDSYKLMLTPDQEINIRYFLVNTMKAYKNHPLYLAGTQASFNLTPYNIAPQKEIRPFDA